MTVHARLTDEYRNAIARLAKALGVAEIPLDANGGAQLTVGDGEGVKVVIYPWADNALLLAVPLLALPEELEYAVTSWLFRKNFYDSELQPFRVACDHDANLVLWGTVPTADFMDGEKLAGLIDTLAQEAKDIINECAMEE